MGTESFSIENGLYGFKRELCTQLGEGNTPPWLYPDTPRTTADNRLEKTADASTFLDACVEAARGENPDYTYYSRDRAYANFRVFFAEGTRLSGPSGTLAMNKPNLVPDRIRERIRDWIDENEDEIYRREPYAEFRYGPRVVVDIGRRGGINDVRLEMHYGN